MYTASIRSMGRRLLGVLAVACILLCPFVQAKENRVVVCQQAAAHGLAMLVGGQGSEGWFSGFSGRYCG